MTGNTVAICMATYNGAQYLDEQLRSIREQTWTDWVLFVRDDGSDDSTVEILKEFVRKNPGKAVLLATGAENLGAKANFARILSAASKDGRFSFFAFADQDDIWFPDKLERSLALLREQPGPALVHTDLEVVNRRGKTLGHSFFRYRALNCHEQRLSRLLIQNNATGCTMVWNRALNDRIDLDQSDAVMHDWWVTLTACTFGTILCLKEPTVYYRQHASNVVGATRVNSLGFIWKRTLGLRRVRDTLRHSMRQGEAFLRLYGHSLSPEQVRVLEAFSGMARQSKLRRVATVFREGFWKQGLIQRLGQLILL